MEQKLVQDTNLLCPWFRVWLRPQRRVTVSWTANFKLLTSLTPRPKRKPCLLPCTPLMDDSTSFMFQRSHFDSFKQSEKEEEEVERQTSEWVMCWKKKQKRPLMSKPGQELPLCLVRRKLLSLRLLHSIGWGRDLGRVGRQGCCRMSRNRNGCRRRCCLHWGR